MLISSVQNPRVKAAARLRERSGRNDQGRIIIDGVREIGRALDAGLEVVEVYVFRELCTDEPHERLLTSVERAGVEQVEVARQVMEKLAFGNRVEGIVAVAKPPKKELVDWKPAGDALVAVVEGAEKPGNLGAILRTADAAGVSAVIVADGGTDLYNPNAIRASLGAIFTVPTFSTTSAAVLDWLRKEKFRIFGARVDGSVEYTEVDFAGRTAIALGSEAHGLSAEWHAPEVNPIRVPLVGSVDSLNLSATAAVLFYEALRQRGQPSSHALRGNPTPAAPRP
ncbi:MAG TPA: RNA methyltransferase [Pirellulaceae bacterium]|jgi:TrmH family RNA methyltransferase